MSKMKTVDELVLEWTEAEREAHKDLIEECRERERTLIENSRACRENLDKLNGVMASLFSSSKELKDTARRLQDDLLRIYFRLHKRDLPAA